MKTKARLCLRRLEVLEDSNKVLKANFALKMIHQMAPWVPTFIQSTKNNTQPFLPFQIATTDELTNTPRCRTVVFRDFLFKDKKSNVLTFNTDIRSGKIKESFPNGLDTTAPIEACFYFPETMEQYRLRGSCFLVSKKTSNISKKIVEKYGIVSPGVSGHHKEDLYKYEDEVNEAMGIENTNATTGENNAAKGSVIRPPTTTEWQMEIRRQWYSLSRTSRSQYRKPDPGKPITSETSEKLDKIQRGVDGTDENAGLENFALVCLCIDKVDYLNLKNGSGGERLIFTRTADEDANDLENWIEEHVCP